MPKTKVTDKLFKGIKIMFEGGATIEEVTEYFDISMATAKRIKKAENIVDYRQEMAAVALKYQSKQKPVSEPQRAQEPQIIEHRQTVTVQATHYMMEELKRQNELLQLISNKLSFIVEQLT